MPTFHTTNPATEETLSYYSYQTRTELDQNIERTHMAYESWRRVTHFERGILLLRLAELLKDQKERLGRLITLEMGKPIGQSVSEIEKCAWVCTYYAENGAAQLGDDHVNTEVLRSYVHYTPLGTLLAIMPWNFPFWQVFRCAAPALMAGNAVVLKHASNTTGCALEMEKLFIKAGFPDHIFKTLLLDSSDIEAVIAHPKIAAVTLTGSTRVGRSVAQMTGKHLKKCVLELGGSDPYVILDDADIELAAKTCVQGRLLNTGQSCIAAKRFIVTKNRSKIFTEAVYAIMTNKKYGNPMENPDLGSMARADLRTTLHEQVSRSQAKGANCLLGGTIDNGTGYFYPATLLSNVLPGMPAYEEEVFGPVASIIEVADEDEAIRVANDTSFGLGAALFSKDIDRAMILAQAHVHAGAVFINDLVKSDPRMPFGGIKDSGYGRELGPHGIKEFVNAKSISVKG